MHVERGILPLQLLGGIAHRQLAQQVLAFVRQLAVGDVDRIHRMDAAQLLRSKL